jgi:hypothetical protein
VTPDDRTETAPNVGAQGEDPVVAPSSAGGADPGRAGAGAPINQGAPGAGPEGPSAYDAQSEAGGQSPLSAPSEGDPFTERPEVFVAGAFVGGFALAQILKRFGP